MKRRIQTFAFVLCTFSLPLPAAAQSKKEPPANKAEVRLADGSTMQVLLLQEGIEVLTKYGKLTVPTSEIRRIECAFRVEDEVAQQIETTLRKLGSSNFKEREAAQQELVGLGAQAYPAVQADADHPDAEVARRVQEVLKAIRERATPEQLQFPAFDRIVAREFTFVGRIVSPALKARNTYFGDVSLKLADVRSLRWLGTGADSVTVVDAAKYANPNTWLETEIAIEPGVSLTISARGQVDLWPQSPGAYSSGPAGYQSGGPMVLPHLGITVRGGTLVGRIGESGTPFVVGDKYEGTPTQRGKLYLHIVPSPWNNASSGSYSVQTIAGGR